MTAYDKNLLANTFFIAGAKSLKDGGFITKAQLTDIRTKTPVLKSQGNILVRLGFLLLGILLYSSIVGAISLFAFTIFNISRYEWAIYVYAMVGAAGIEFFVRHDYFGYGLDDAFILGFLSMICLAIGINTESPTAAFAAMAVFGLVCCIRYVHTISALVGLIGITGFLCCLAFDLEVIPKLYVPFTGLLLAIAMYLFYHKTQHKPEAYFYKQALQVLQVFSLALGYASVNYLVIRELSVDWMGMEITPGNDIPLAWIFYILTFAIPIGYLWYALQIKSREMLLMGALALGCSVMTIRYYYSIMPPETALILAGMILFAVAYLLIRKLRHKESGITFGRDRHSDKNALLHAQAILVNSQINVKPAESGSGDMPFGGGGFSGGGASETY